MSRWVYVIQIANVGSVGPGQCLGVVGGVGQSVETDTA